MTVNSDQIFSNTFVATLQNQRNVAFDEIARLSARVAVLEAEIEKLKSPPDEE